MAADLSKNVQLAYVKIKDEPFYKIHNHDALRPFFMSVVSDSNHWMFISSNGGLTAGRKNSEFSLFPYYTDDKITESAEITGSKTLIAVEEEGVRKLWEPFSVRSFGIYAYTRNLYKSEYGNKIMFEEINHDLGLAYRYMWSSSSMYGFVRESELINLSNETRRLEIVDGIQNLLPYGVLTDLQGIRSNLVDAYKKNELQPETGLGIFALSAIIVDRAEPSEALKANVAWSLGMKNPKYLVSSMQLDAFRFGRPLEQEEDIRGEKGAYFLATRLELSPDQKEEWMIVANVNQGPSQVADLNQMLTQPEGLRERVLADVDKGTERLVQLVAGSDGLQETEDAQRNSRHFANVMFNIMRGGIFDRNYTIERKDFLEYLRKANTELFIKHKESLNTLPEEFTLEHLNAFSRDKGDGHLTRLSLEYLPLKFSRRHGDPSRPWNRFSINTESEVDGSKILDYEGNWRDIFQNWEALAHSYPDFIEGMIFKFLNATTFDGYNPYRVTKDGFDWETIEPHDPWSYIGYWGDHQIIYLLKFLEFAENYYPGDLQSYLTQDLFVYACVPYRIKGYEDIVKNPKDTIEFDGPLDAEVRRRRDEIGADGALLSSAREEIMQVNLTEKLLATVLAKISNLVPEGGIWMNTQRPEWNDANNALVGNGLSMVTLYYLRRFMAFQKEVLKSVTVDSAAISSELHQLFTRIWEALKAHQPLLSGSFGVKDRRKAMDALGSAASEYRLNIYDHGFSGDRKSLSFSDLASFTDLVLEYLEHSIRANRRSDRLYHAYNLITLEDGTASVSYLDEMLEGQVAALSSGYLSPEECLTLLDGLKESKLFREDQYSYILYPDKDLPRFEHKNNIPSESVEGNPLLEQLIRDGNRGVVERDAQGKYHFNGNFNNADSLAKALDALPEERYGELVKAHRKSVLAVFEQVFNHKAFTGRSGTFFGFEGLGSIYWHMVSKLLLAVQECCHQSYKQLGKSEVTGKLIDHYYEILAGIGAHKSPSLYGAFPTDPYSHTPAHRGAQQPGMTGQVKEDIIARFGELGVFVRAGQLGFDPYLLNRDAERLTRPSTFEYRDTEQRSKALELAAGTFGFTLCQVPVIYSFGEHPGITLTLNGGEIVEFEGHLLDRAHSLKVFNREGVEKIEVKFE